MKARFEQSGVEELRPGGGSATALSSRKGDKQLGVAFLLAVSALLLAGCNRAGAVQAKSGPASKSATSGSPKSPVVSEDGYDLWLRYVPVRDEAIKTSYQEALSAMLLEGNHPSLLAAREELQRGLLGLLGQAPRPLSSLSDVPTLVVGTQESSAVIAALDLGADLAKLGSDGFLLRRMSGPRGQRLTVVAAPTELGVLYGSFALLRHLQRGLPLNALEQTQSPRVRRRMLNHWDNLDRTVERGYAGLSLWDWDALPDVLSPRYKDYARANASIGINGAAITNVNADARVLTPTYLERVAAIADVLRPYGVRVYLTARFSAPMEIGGLPTADPLDARVVSFWNAKVEEIYARIADFGGFVVKANSEGQPGPQDYQRSHTDGANLLARALAPHGGVVMWRAFVYQTEDKSDRIKQAYAEFKPLDQAFDENVFIQVKNGPLDFQPREPIHPLLGGLRQASVALELQLTKEYLGQDTHLAYLGPLFEEVLRADTYAEGEGSTVADVVDGSLFSRPDSAIAGVSNVGTDRDWTGSHFNQANWYVFGRMAWDPQLSARQVAEEWADMTWSTNDDVSQAVVDLMMGSRETLVNYMTPLGLVHIMAEGHHYGPGPWVSDLPREEWTSVYYHRADAEGIGFDRTPSGSDAVSQYAEPLRASYESPATTPLSLLLFFHHVGWDARLQTGRTTWEELVFRYDEGVRGAKQMGERWAQLRDRVDARRFAEVSEMLAIQAAEARWWRDAVLRYFMDVSGRTLPEGAVAPERALDFYENLPCPEDRTKPRCPPIMR